MRVADDVLISGIPSQVRAAKRVRAIAEQMIAMGPAECEDRKGELIERIHAACSQKKIVDQIGRVSRQRVMRWLERGIDAAVKRDGGGKRLDRRIFHQRREVCQQCEHWKQSCETKGWKDGCDLLDTPCSVELRWMSADAEWCPLGKQPSSSPPQIRVRLTPTVLRTPTSSIAVCTVVAGDECNELSEYTTSHMRRYADRVGADFVVLRENQVESWGLANKFQVHQVVAMYDRTLFVDCDVFIRPIAPNIFELPAGKVWMHSDRDRVLPGVFDQVVSEVTKISAAHGWPDVDRDMIAVANSGVVLCDREHSEMWRPPTELIQSSSTAEQSVIEANRIRLGYDLGKLDSRWNWQWYFKGFADHIAEAWFVHPASAKHGVKLELLTRLDDAITDRYILPSDAIVITATDHAFLRGAYMLAWTLLRRNDARLRVYDLGIDMTDPMVSQMQSWGVEFVRFEPAISVVDGWQTFAKPWMIRDAMRDHATVVWLDADVAVGDSIRGLIKTNKETPFVPNHGGWLPKENRNSEHALSLIGPGRRQWGNGSDWPCAGVLGFDSRRDAGLIDEWIAKTTLLSDSGSLWCVAYYDQGILQEILDCDLQDGLVWNNFHVPRVIDQADARNRRRVSGRVITHFGGWRKPWHGWPEVLDWGRPFTTT